MSERAWTTVVEEDENGDCLITFPEDFLNSLGWKPGDTFIWEVVDDKIYLRKKDESISEQTS